MTRVAQRLQIINVQRSSTLVDGNYVVDHLRWGKYSFLFALLAQRIHLELLGSELPPRSALIEFRVVVSVALVGLLLRKPRSLGCFLDGWHIISGGFHL